MSRIAYPLSLRAASAGLLVAIALGGCRSGGKKGADGESAARSPTGATTVLIYRSDPAGIATDCAAVVAEEWAVPDPPPANLVEEAIRESLRGVGPSTPLHPEGARPLLEYFRGVRIDGSVATLQFDSGALVYLNNAACAQMTAKAPLVRTVLGFPGVREVRWEIDGEPFADWDA